MPPLISVALCTYNGEKFVAEQIESLLAQDYPNLEIILCDDGSSDRTIEIAQEFQSPKIFIHQNDSNVGLNKNFERAFQLCRGQYIAPCDQDDIWASNKLTILAENIGQKMLVFCDSELIDEQGSSLGIKFSDLVVIHSGDDPRPFMFGNCVSGHASLFRRELLADAIPIPKVNVFDWWLAYVATCIGGISYVDQCLVKYRQHPGSQMDCVSLKPESTSEPSAKFKDDEHVEWLQQLTRVPHKECTALAKKLCLLWNARRDQYFCFGLAFVLFRGRGTLLYMRSGRPLEPFKSIFDSIWGFKIKRLYKPNKYRVD